MIQYKVKSTKLLLILSLIIQLLVIYKCFKKVCEAFSFTFLLSLAIRQRQINKPQIVFEMFQIFFQKLRIKKSKKVKNAKTKEKQNVSESSLYLFPFFLSHSLSLFLSLSLSLPSFPSLGSFIPNVYKRKKFFYLSISMFIKVCKSKT